MLIAGIARAAYSLPAPRTCFPGTAYQKPRVLPWGQLLARRPSHAHDSELRPKPSKRPYSPADMFLFQTQIARTLSCLCRRPSPTTCLDNPDQKPKPTKAPHLRFSAEAYEPRDVSPSPSRVDFGHQIDFGFCKTLTQDFASSPSSAKQSLGHPTRACAKLLVRSGLRCSLCFQLRSACLGPEMCT